MNISASDSVLRNRVKFEADVLFQMRSNLRYACMLLVDTNYVNPTVFALCCSNSENINSLHMYSTAKFLPKSQHKYL